MFPSRYFASRYFPPRYFPSIGADAFSAPFPIVIASPIVTRHLFSSLLVDVFPLLSPIVQTEEW